MYRQLVHGTTWVALPLLAAAAPMVGAATVDLGNGFRDHGVATPVSNHRGTVATADGQGRNVVLVWLFDHTGGYALLSIDAETGQSRQVAMPFPTGGDCPYASVLSRQNRFYTHFGNHFVEYDPAVGEFTFVSKTAPQMAMSMTEDDQGVIWSASYPQSGVVSYNPATKEFRDYGHIFKQNWAQYPRAVATDDTGWVYVGTGSTASQIIALDPKTGAATTILEEAERKQAYPVVVRDENGKVYGQAAGGKDNPWIELYGGKARRLEAAPERRPKAYIAESQSLFHRAFPDGKVLRVCDLSRRRLVVENPATGESKEVTFDYTSEGAHLMGMATAPNGTIAGGTAFPMCFFSYDPATDAWQNFPCLGQWNAVTPGNNRYYVGMYTSGGLLEWDPSRPWVPTDAKNPESNPKLIHANSSPTLMRPTCLLVHPDGKTLVLGGTPGYGRTGGGMLIFDLPTGEATLLTHEQLIEHHSVNSVAAFGEGKLLVGSTVSAGSGGERKASLAELYVFDMATRTIEWREPVLPGINGYNAMLKGPGDLVYVIADRRHLVVFDAARRAIVHQQDLEPSFGLTNSQQGPRVFVTTPEGDIYLLMVKGIARFDPKSYEVSMVAESPVAIGPGGDYLNGRIYFGNGSHLYSYELPARQP